MTLEQVYNLWYKDKRRQVKDSSLSVYVVAWKKHLKPAFGKYEVSDITRQVVKPWVYGLLDTQSLSVRYIQDLLMILKMIIRYANEELEQPVSSLSWNIAWPTANITHAAQSFKRYTVEQVRKITNYILENSTSESLGVLLALCCGMRIGEVSALTWADIDLKAKTVNIDKSMGRCYTADEDGNLRKTVVRVGKTKTYSSTRVIPFPNKLLDLFKRFSAIYKPEYYVTSCKIKPIEPRLFRVHARDILIEAGIDSNEILTFHSLRHTFASMMIDVGADVKTVSSILGHANVSITLDLYVHPSKETKSKAMNMAMKKIF